MRIVSVFFSKIIGSRNQRLVKRLMKSVSQINSFEKNLECLTDEQISQKKDEFINRFKQGESLDQLQPEAFAVVREASKRTLGLRHFDVQMVGGMVLHQGKVAEMCTGEGKTLASTLPAYLNTISGQAVHIVTVNDYLAKRDAEWMSPVYQLLGLSVGVNLPSMTREEKKAAYLADITYGTNNEFGFDYLRDNMAFLLEEKVQRGLGYAIVDEVDSILIDEARTPLIISGAAENSSALYQAIDKIVPQLVRQEDKESEGDYHVDEKGKQVFLSEDGHLAVEKKLIDVKLIEEGDSLYSASNIILMHHLNAALKAHAIFQKDVDYIVQNNEVVIVDEHTGRTMPGRRWSEGLHQAIEAKEGVVIQNENQTLASITFQNYFRLYNKLSGMTGTADTEAYELHSIYGLEVVVIPTNQKIARTDYRDLVYMTAQDKFNAIVEDIKKCKENGQPVLVGTVSIEVSELLSRLLTTNQISHKVLNAKFHEKEADIIIQAGRPGAVTIATNMAGRGTDIVLGGNVEKEIEALDATTDDKRNELMLDWKERHAKVIAAGGLHVIATERHESRRIDNQLRGRSGRQGDPGSSRFYLSLEDSLLRIFAGDKLRSFMQRISDDGMAIESSILSRSIEGAQRKVESHNFDIRKQLLEYDDVANDQRKVIYEQRAQLMALSDISDSIANITNDVFLAVVEEHIPKQSLEEQWDISGLEDCLAGEFGLKISVKQWLEETPDMSEDEVRERVQEAARELFASKELRIGADVMRQFEKSVMLQNVDSHWKDHLAAMDHLRQGIHLRGYAQKNPKQEYKRESYSLFTLMLDYIKRSVISVLATFEIKTKDEMALIEQQRRESTNYSISLHHEDILPGVDADELSVAGEQEAFENNAPFKRGQPKVGRNDPCPCGSNKKYKQCHGKL